MSNKPRVTTLFTFIIVIVACYIAQGCDKKSSTGKGVTIAMETYYVGRFSVDVPVEMGVAVRTAELRYAEVDEIVWTNKETHDRIRSEEWNNFIAEIKKLTPPKRKNNVIIKMRDFQEVGLWAKGVYYYYDNFNDIDGRWALLVDEGPVGVWFKGNSVVDKECVNHYLEQNIETSAKSYSYVEHGKQNTLPDGDWFYLEHGAINRPYRSQEESYIRFEGHPLNLVLDIKMEMDVGYYRETGGLIEKTKELLAEAALMPGLSASKIRLGKRVVAGMKGEESILRMSEDGRKILQFAWEFNGKEDSGEYPTTTIEMETPDNNLDNKTAIWDAVLDSMKPMFERKK